MEAGARRHARQQVYAEALEPGVALEVPAVFHHYVWFFLRKKMEFVTKISKINLYFNIYEAHCRGAASQYLIVIITVLGLTPTLNVAIGAAFMRLNLLLYYF